MNAKASLFNPFPGLRSFRSDEDYLFFGREEQTLELMGRLQRNRFIAVVGTSGRGKSSLVRCGLLSRLQGGGMVDAGAHWEIAVMHPGGDPLRHLAEALLDAGLHDREEENALPQLLATLGRSQFGLIQAVRQAGLPAGTNFLLVVDQFEEIFRYDEAGQAESEVANDFIAMLREASVQTEVPIYIVATMRSDFIGDCSRFEGLAETVNRGEYLIPGLSREQFKSAIEGPIRVAGGQITPRLLQRLLNDLGEEEDQLPCLQHALMRTWRVWQGRAEAEALDLEDYAQVGKMSQALSVHANEVYEGLAGERQRELCAALFKALTVEGSEKRGIRRPRRLQTLCRILGVEKAELLPVIDAFRQPEVSFLVPPTDVELRDATVIDLSHESLMRVWTRLREWVNEEAQSVGIFRRLSESAALWRQGRTELCRDPELSIARAWVQSNRPNAAWAEQYDGNFDEAMGYLKASNDAAETEVREREERARAEAARKTRRQHWVIAGLATAVVVLLVGAFFGIRAQRRAADQAARVDLATGSRLLDEGKIGDGLAHLVSAAGRQSASSVAMARILTTLANRNFSLPSAAPLQLPSPATDIQYLAGRQAALVLSEDGQLRLLDVAGWRIVREYQFAQKIQAGGLRLAAKNPGLFAVALVNGTVLVCDTETGQARFPALTPPRRVPELAQRVRPANTSPFFALSPDGKWLKTVDDSWAIFDTTTGEERSAGNTYHRHIVNDPRLAPFAPDSGHMVTSTSGITSVSPTGGIGTTNSRLEWRTVPDGTLVSTFPLDETVNSGVGQGMMFSADGRRHLVVGNLRDRGGAVAAYVRDTGTFGRIGTPVPISALSAQRTTQVWLTPDGTRIIVALEDRGVTVYDVETGKPAYPALRHRGPAVCAGMSDDGSILATLSVDGFVRLWDLRTGALAVESTFKQDRPGPTALSPDGHTLIISDASGLLRRLQTTKGPARPLLMPRPAGTYMAEFAGHRPGHLLWFESPRAKQFEIASARWTGPDWVFPFAISPHGANGSIDAMIGSFADALRPGDVLIARPSAGAPRIWTLDSKGIGSDLAFADPLASDTVFLRSVSGKVAAAPFSAEGEPPVIGIWNLHTGQRIARLTGVDATGWAAMVTRNATGFSADDRRLVLQSAKEVRVYDIAQAKLLFRLPSDEKAGFRVARFSPDGQRLLTGNAWGTVQVWDGNSGKLLRSKQAHGFAVTRFDVSDDGAYYASLSQEGTAQIWDAATDEPVGELLTHGGALLRATFTADGKWVSISASDGSARVWDVASSLPLSDSMEHGGGNVPQAIPSADGRFLLTYSGYLAGTPNNQIWAAPPRGRSGRAPKWLLRLATVCAGRVLTEEGKIVPTSEDFDRFDEVRRQIADLPAGDPYAEWGRWFLSDSPSRSIAPGFTVTPAEASTLAAELGAPALLPELTARDDDLLLQRKYVESEPLARELLARVLQRDGAGGRTIAAICGGLPHVW